MPCPANIRRVMLTIRRAVCGVREQAPAVCRSGLPERAPCVRQNHDSFDRRTSIKSPHSPWTIFLYTNNHLRDCDPACKDFLCILVLRPFILITSTPLSSGPIQRHSERSLPVFLSIRRVLCDGCRQTQSKNLSS